MNKNEIVVTSTENLRKIVFEVTDKLLKKYYAPIEPKDTETYLSRQEVSDMLGINLTTLWTWTKKGHLVAYSIQGRVWYKRSEIEAAMIKLK